MRVEPLTSETWEALANLLPRAQFAAGAAGDPAS
jgi:hypothetical protein